MPRVYVPRVYVPRVYVPRVYVPRVSTTWSGAVSRSVGWAETLPAWPAQVLAPGACYVCVTSAAPSSRLAYLRGRSGVAWSSLQVRQLAWVLRARKAASKAACRMRLAATPPLHT